MSKKRVFITKGATNMNAGNDCIRAIGSHTLPAAGDRLHDIVPLRHPRTGTKAQYSFNGENELLEVQQVSGEDHCYFVDNSVMKDGSIFVLSPVDPNFILLHYLDLARAKTDDHPGRFGVLEDALNDAIFPATRLLAKAKNVRLDKICDIKDKGDIYIRLNDDKVLEWLGAKVRAAATALC